MCQVASFECLELGVCSLLCLEVECLSMASERPANFRDVYLVGFRIALHAHGVV